MYARLVRVLPFALFTACVGVVTPDGEPDLPAPPVTAPPPKVMPMPMPAPTPTLAPASGPWHLRRLTRDEYSNSVRDLLGETSRPADSWPVDGLGDAGFAAPGGAGLTEVRRFADVAWTVAGKALTDRWSTIVPCPRMTPDEPGCVRTFLTNFGRRAFRRPLTADELATWTALYTRARMELQQSFPEAIETLLAGLLQAPQFLYVGGIEARDGVTPLPAHALAARLATFLWGSVPDEELMAAADAGSLGQPATLQAQVRRMLKSLKAGDTIRTFHHQWLRLGALPSIEKDPRLHARFDAKARIAAARDVDLFAHKVILDGDGTLTTLLTAPFAYVDRHLAPIYGLADVTSDQPVRQAVDPAQRAGLLTSPAFLAVHAAASEGSPVKRGQIIREQLLCHKVPEPPADVPPLATSREGASTRERYAAHSSDGVCRGCHELMDPLGFAFEHYDAVGAWRDKDAGRPVDATGSLNGVAKKVSFDGAVELAQQLAGTEEVQHCVAEQWWRFALGRLPTAAELPHLQQLQRTFVRSGLDLRELLVAIATSPSFTHVSH